MIFWRKKRGRVMGKLDYILEKTGLQELYGGENPSGRDLVRYRERTKIDFKQYFYLVVEGSIDSYYFSHNGNAYNISKIIPSDHLIVGLINISKEKKYFQESVMGYINKGSLVLKIPIEKITTLYKSSIPFLHKFIDIYGSYSFKLIKENFYRTTLNLKEYLAYMILSYETDGKLLVISYSDLATLIKCTRSKLYSALSFLEEKGYIRKEKNYILILDRKGLEESISDNVL